MRDGDLGSLDTEARNKGTTSLDTMGTAEVLRHINDEDMRIAGLVREATASIATAVDLASARWQRGGRVALFGAGTSGRLAALDAAELPPTYGTPPDRYQARPAGGLDILRTAVEGAEDDTDAGRLAAEDLGIDDVAVGLAASGRTPYVVAALAEAGRRGAATIGFACVHAPELAAVCDVTIELPTGAEVVSGSTRMKAGNAEKMALTAFSTALMVRAGGVYENLMVSMRPTNGKLRDRAVRMVSELTDAPAAECRHALETATWDIKVAVVMLECGASVQDAVGRLAAVGDNLRAALG